MTVKRFGRVMRETVMKIHMNVGINGENVILREAHYPKDIICSTFTYRKRRKVEMILRAVELLSE